jgi:hypothetical protein
MRHLTVLALHHYAIRYGIDISRDTRIGGGSTSVILAVFS